MNLFRAHCFALLALAASAAAAEPLLIFSAEHPVSFFFRETESTAARRTLTYEEWSTRYSRLSGVMGKMLDEEIAGRSAAQPYYRRFKAEHPEQAVLLHANGTFRSPNADNRAYHAGHWLYYHGTRVDDAVVAAAKTLTLHVGDVRRFDLSPYQVNSDMREDVGLCALADDGRPDWNRAEQARLIGVDAKAGTLTLERGLYGSTPQSFAAGRAYVAAHVAQTWGTVNKLWQFNMATTCPRDAAGRTAANVWAGELIAAMRKGGAIDYVDGVEFDVPFRVPISLGRNRKPDADADGRPDDGIVAGQPVFAAGIDGFFRQLRAALPDKLILADVGGKSQRSPATLNGVETEGWPALNDPEFRSWSSALNDHVFWQTRARPPIFTYGLLKFRGVSDVPFPTIRLTLAGPLLVGAAVPFTYDTPAGANGIWDELVGGESGRRGWLGRALGPARQLALAMPDLLAGITWTRAVKSDTANVSRDNERVALTPRDAAAPELSLRISGLMHPAAGDIVVAARATAAPWPGYPRDHYRVMSIAIVPAGAEVPVDPRREPPGTPLDGRPMDARFYHRNVAAGPIDVVIRIEGGAPVVLESLRVHAAPDLVTREFEHGVVLANPSYAPQAFDLAVLYPGKSFRRLKATAAQDARTNDGSPVRGIVTLGPKDALFLRREP